MTNPTRTRRAELQAEIEKLQAELESAWPKEGDQAYFKCTIHQVDNDTDGIVDVKVEGDGDIYQMYSSALIPAADLIPREEHERAVAEAVDKALNGDLAAEEKAYALGAMNTRVLNEHDALDVLVKEYAYKPLDNSPTELEWAHDGQLYRVTVERVDHIVDANKMIKPADAHPVHPGRPHDYDQGYPPDDKPADAEPVDQASANRLVEWYAANNREHKMTWSHEVNGRTYFICVAPHDGTGYAPDPQAVAPVGVVKDLNWLADTMESEDADGWALAVRTALSRITELPPPSEWARKRAELWIGAPKRMRQFAAALIERAALLESEGDHD